MERRPNRLTWETRMRTTITTGWCMAAMLALAAGCQHAGARAPARRSGEPSAPGRRAHRAEPPLEGPATSVDDTAPDGEGEQSDGELERLEVRSLPADYARVVDWGDAPATCVAATRPGRLHHDLRYESLYAAMQFLRWVALMVDVDRAETHDLTPYLDEVRRFAKARGQVFLVVSPELAPALDVVGARASSRAEAILSTFEDGRRAYVVEFVVEGMLNDGSGKSPVIGTLRTEGLENEKSMPRSGRFGVKVRFCAMPSNDGRPTVYLEWLTQS